MQFSSLQTINISVQLFANSSKTRKQSKNTTHKICLHETMYLVLQGRCWSDKLMFLSNFPFFQSVSTRNHTYSFNEQLIAHFYHNQDMTTHYNCFLYQQKQYSFDWSRTLIGELIKYEPMNNGLHDIYGTLVELGNF